jgi:signal transduction histidine kinase/ligand-binding sensor domain-containing protein
MGSDMPRGSRNRELLCRFLSIVLAGLAVTMAVECRSVERTTRGGFMLLGWSSEDGLAAGNIYGLARTPDGFLWLATDLGLIRFDGERFRALDAAQFPPAEGDRVTCLQVGRQGVLWAGTEGGRLLRGSSGVFQEVELPAEARGKRLNALAEDGEGALWVGTSGAGVLCGREGKWKNCGATNGLPANEASQVVADARGRIWVISGGRLLSWEGGRWRQPARPVPSGQTVVTMAASTNGSLWAATTAEVNFRGGRLFKLADEQWSEMPAYPWPQDSMRSAIRGMVEEPSGRLWVSTSGGGVFRWQGAGEWQPLRQGPLAHEVVNALLLDQEGTLWIGLQGGQLFQAHAQAVTALRLEMPNEQNIVQSVCCRRDSTLWAGTYGGGAYCLRSGQWTRYGTEEGLANLYVFSVYEDSHSELWAGTRSGLYRLEHGRFELCNAVPAELPVLSLAETRDGALWLGSNRGLWRLRGGTAKGFGAPEGFTIPDDVRASAEGPDGRVWAAVRRVGLYRQVNDERFERYKAEQWPRGVDIRALHFDPEGELWIATFGQGVFRLKNGEFRQWTLRDGMPSDYCVGLEADAAGQLWVSTLNGIFGCTPRGLEDYARGHGLPLFSRHLSSSEGLDGAVCSGWGQPVAARSADGRLWFPNQRAVAVFDPETVMERGPRWPVTVEEVRVDGVVEPIGPQGAVRIKSGAHQVEFDYTLPNLLAPGRLRFRYRLKGLEDGWTDAQQRRAAFYSHLAPGRYQFNVMACGPEGDWQQTQRPLQLEVVPRLWERPSVRAAAGAGVLGTVAGVVWVIGRARMRGRLLRLEAQHAAERERRRIARDLHDELGSGLTEIMLLGDLGSQEGVPSEEARGTTRNIAQKTRQLAAALDEIVWTTNPRNDAMPNLTGYLCDYAQRFLGTTPVRCRLDVSGIPVDARLDATARHNLFLAYKEALRNAARHSGAGEVWVRMRCDPERLRIMVEDDGRGFDGANLSGHGNGLQNMRERLEAAGGRMEINSRPEKGTTVTFELSLASLK